MARPGIVDRAEALPIAWRPRWCKNRADKTMKTALPPRGVQGRFAPGRKEKP